MATGFGLRIKVVRGRAPERGRRGRALLRLAVTGLTAIGLSQILPLPAAFGQTYYYSGTVTATINVFQSVKAISLSSGSVVFGSCSFQDNTSSPNGLPLPNGHCTTNATPVTVTNTGTVSATVTVGGADAVPSSGGPHWGLCVGSNIATASSTTGTTCTFNGQIQNEQRVSLPSGSTGTFTLSFAGFSGCTGTPTASGISTGATSASLEAAIQAVSCIGANAIVRSSPPGGPYTILFGGPLANTQQPLLGADGSLLSPPGSIAVGYFPLAGSDQYRIAVGPGDNSGIGVVGLTNAAACDTALVAGSCVLAPAAFGSNSFLLRGPYSTSDKSGSFTTTVTYIAS